jgi:hypothetical protein
MDLVVFENNKTYVIDEFREGRFDYIELASDVAETRFFQFLFDQGLVERLAEHYPSPRKRHHVPMWMYLAARLSPGDSGFRASPTPGHRRQSSLDKPTNLRCTSS